MPIREESFRIGCGRYLQRAGLLKECGGEIASLGKAPLIVGGKTALELTRETIEKSVRKSGLRYGVEEHRGSCNRERAEELAQRVAREGYDVIVGVGGGVLMDFAKLIGDVAHLPVINIPTSSATCAAYTPLSVCYTPEGRTVGTVHFGYEVSAVLVDTAILAAQPTRLLLAGVFDALAKFLEIKQRYCEESEVNPLGLDWAYHLAKRSYQVLTEKTPGCLSDLKEGKITPAVEEIFFTAIAVTGVISGIARGSNQTALAHKFYEGTRAMFFEESRTYLHGEIVGVGLLLQNHFNGETEHNEFLLSLMKQYDMPSNLLEIGLTPTTAVQQQYFEKLKAGSAIDETDPDELTRLQAGLTYLFARR